MVSNVCKASNKQCNIIIIQYYEFTTVYINIVANNVFDGSTMNGGNYAIIAIEIFHLELILCHRYNTLCTYIQWENW